MRQFFNDASMLSNAGQPFATATVVRAERPTSGKPGDRAIIRADGTLAGWIGGSCAEPTVIAEALRAIADGRTRLIRLSPEPGRHRVPEGITEVPMTCFSGGTLDIFIEPHQPRARLVVTGSSPVAEALVRLGREMNYHVIALDPDAPGDVPRADTTLRDIAQLSAHVTPLTFVVVATHGRYDEPVLAAALRTEAPYVGLVSSHKRGEAVRAALRAEGITDAQLARLKLPAGLDIGARHGDEIALSILAELIQVRRSIETVDWKQPRETGESSDAVAEVLASAVTQPIEQSSTPHERVPLTMAGASHVSKPGATATDPVCGMIVRTEGAKNTFAHNGVTYYFCCGGCRGRFAANPAAYIA